MRGSAGKTGRFTPNRSLWNASNGGFIHLSKSCWPGLNAWSEREKKHSPSIEREFVACFCTKKRNKRRGWGWEVRDWQEVTNLEESAEI